MEHIIETERLVLRPLVASDFETTFAYSGDLENTRYMVFLPNENEGECREFLENSEREWEKEKPEFFEFAIVLKSGRSEGEGCGGGLKSGKWNEGEVCKEGLKSGEGNEGEAYNEGYNEREACNEACNGGAMSKPIGEHIGAVSLYLLENENVAEPYGGDENEIVGEFAEPRRGDENEATGKSIFYYGREAEFGWILNKRYWGNGYATEAVWSTRHLNAATSRASA